MNIVNSIGFFVWEYVETYWLTAIGDSMLHMLCAEHVLHMHPSSVNAFHLLPILKKKEVYNPFLIPNEWSYVYRKQE